MRLEIRQIVRGLHPVMIGNVLLTLRLHSSTRQLLSR